jgi:hypothetical protein
MCQQDFLTTGDAVPNISSATYQTRYVAEVQEILIINMMEVDDDAERLF